MTKWAGWLITLAGVGHTIGSLRETLPDHLGTWVDGSLWSERNYAAQSDAAAGFWYSVFSFGPPMLLIGLMVLWLDRRGLTPPPFLAWAIAAWVVLTFAASGPSPLPLLLVAAIMLLIAARRSRQTGPHQSTDTTAWSRTPTWSATTTSATASSGGGGPLSPTPTEEGGHGQR